MDALTKIGAEMEGFHYAGSFTDRQSTDRLAHQ